VFLKLFFRIQYFKWKSLILAGKWRDWGVISPLITHEVQSTKLPIFVKVLLPDEVFLKILE
jgi:hypothetical protein